MRESYQQFHFTSNMILIVEEHESWTEYLILCIDFRQFSSVQLLSHVQLFATPWTAARQASLSITNSWSPPKPMSIELMMPSYHLILCHPLLLLPSIFPSIRVFSNESALHIRWPKYWSFSFNITPSNEHPGLICFRMDWLDLLVVHGTLKSLLQHRNSKASILQSSAFFIAQLSHPYLTTGKTIALTTWSFVGKLMSLLFNMLSLPLPKTVSHISMSLHKTKWFFSIKGISRVPEYLTVIYLNVYIHGVCLQFSEKKGPTYSCSIISQLWQTIFPRDFCRWAPGKKWGGHSDSKQNR